MSGKSVPPGHHHQLTCLLHARPIPLYTTFEEVRLVAKGLNEALEDEDLGRSQAEIEVKETS